MKKIFLMMLFFTGCTKYETEIGNLDIGNCFLFADQKIARVKEIGKYSYTVQTNDNIYNVPRGQTVTRLDCFDEFDKK
jgi:hypothetical protein